VLSFAAALALGLVLASFRVSPVPPLRWVGAAYVEWVRGVPLAVQFIFLFYGLTKVGIQFGLFTSALVVLTTYTAAFTTEAIRSGINSVSAGQAEAARSLGLNFRQTLGSIVLPQAMRTVVGPLGGGFIALIKNSSLASVIAVTELMFFADRISNDTAQPVPAYIGVAIAYLLLTYPTGLLLGLIERRVAIKR
jgi:His/Glu/Gln/Arg/opine family amino acid ABC transporter permease subunit